MDNMAASPVQEELQPGNKQFRNHLAAAVRSIKWSYAIFWSVSSTGTGILTWKDGFYNGEVKTRKVTNSTSRLTADQLALQRSEQLRELYESLQLAGGGGDGHRATRPRPVAALSPEDLGDTEWFYVISMTYAFRPGQGLPGKSLARNEHVWLRNANLADSKTFPRAILAKSASIQTIVCMPLMGGVLELGTTDLVLEDLDLVSRATTPFLELQFPACTEEPNSSPSTDDGTGEEATDNIMFEDIDHTAAMEPVIVSEEQHELARFLGENLPDADFGGVAMEIDELYSLCEGLDVQPLDDDWIAMEGLLEAPPSPAQAPRAATEDAGHTALSTPADGCRLTSFTPWARSDADDMAVMKATGMEPQKLLKKVVAGGRAWVRNNGDDWSSVTRTQTQESGIVRNHVMSERRRREKLNEMFLVLKSLIPSTRKVDKASILAETIAYLKELERRVQELDQSSKELSMSSPSAAAGLLRRRHDDEVVVVGGKNKVCRGAKRKKVSELDAGERQKDQPPCPSNVISITVADKEVLLDVQCRWKEKLMARVFNAVKSLHLDVLSVQSSTLNGLMALKFAGSAAVAPGMITEALQKAISSNP